MQYQAIDNFYPRAADLRAVFDRKFADPLRTHSERFVWDYWHVPGQFSHLRTPAFHYFPKQKYEAFHRYLVRWGRDYLGCHDISPPWLSCYIDGCRQEVHKDVPHGPLAFVFSLTPKNPRFTGGETFIQRPRARIEALFNRLTLFNPSLPHGVREVRGTRDPREGRLVIHGWFVQPRPYWIGPLCAQDVMAGISAIQKNAVFHARDSGLISLQIHITKTGTVAQAKPLFKTLSARDHKQIPRLLSHINKLQFPPKKRPTRLVLPLVITAI